MAEAGSGALPKVLAQAHRVIDDRPAPPAPSQWSAVREATSSHKGKIARLIAGPLDYLGLDISPVAGLVVGACADAAGKTHFYDLTRCYDGNPHLSDAWRPRGGFAKRLLDIVIALSVLVLLLPVLLIGLNGFAVGRARCW